MKKHEQLEPRVGIFWVVEERLVLDSSLLREAEPYGDCLTHRTSHIDFWSEQQRLGTVPRDIEYEEPPRGRVTYNTKSQKFSFFADRCILKDKAKMALVKKAMHLPVNILVDTDPHYRCPTCLREHRSISNCL